MAQVERTALVRGIRRWDLVAYGINFVVGAGIFGLPSKIYSLSGSLSLVAYGICAAAVVLIVLCFAEVGSRFNETGGPYLYARLALGQVVGFEVGWLRSLAGVTAFAANVNLLVDYLSFVWPTASTQLWRTVIITGVTLSLTAVNLIGVRDAAFTNNILAAGKLLPLLIFIVVGLFFVQPQNLTLAARPGFAAVSLSVLLLMQAFAGFDSIAIAAGEIREPQRTVPFALFTTIAVVVLLYVSIQFVCIGTLPELATSTRPLADAASRFLGTPGGYLITAGAIVSITGNLNGQLLVTPRTLFAMAEQSQLPRMLAAVHTRFHTPYVSILIAAAVILGFALSGTFIQLVTISVLARLAVYVATCTSLLVLRRRGDLQPPLFKAPAGIPVAVVSVGLCAWLLTSSTRREALTAAVAAAVGLMVYALNRLVTPASRSDKV
jgi:amino acid transporter